MVEQAALEGRKRQAAIEKARAQQKQGGSNENLGPITFSAFAKVASGNAASSTEPSAPGAAADSNSSGVTVCPIPKKGEMPVDVPKARYVNNSARTYVFKVGHPAGREVHPETNLVIGKNFRLSL